MGCGRASHPGELDHATPSDQQLPGQELDQLTLRGIALERIVATMAEDRDRLLDHALVEHPHDGLVIDGHQPARHDREI